MNIIAATTFSINGYNDYAHRLIKTFIEYWPKTVTLYAYYDDIPSNGWKDSADNVVYIKLNDPGLLAFKEQNKNNPKNSSTNFLNDGIRFSHKVFAYVDAALKPDVDIAIWLDGDSITHQPVTEKVIVSWLNNKMAGALLRPWLYTETGFHIFDMRFPQARNFMTQWREYYTKNTVWNLPHYTDCHTYDAVMATYSKDLWNNLSPDNLKHSHPFVNGVLGQHMDHAKGPRKKEGRSKKSDLVVNRTEDYWKKI